jgi:glycosyltransferase involved in cell wall biosynthesis
MFDIVIPVWKMKTNYLKTCLESIQAQTFKNFKCFIIDGTPTDWEEYEEQQRMIKGIMKDDSRIQYHRHRNLDEPFVAEAMNQGTELGSNPYILYIGGDDFLYNHFFNTMQTYILDEEEERVGVFFSMIQKNEKDIIDMGEFKLGRVQTWVLNHYLVYPFMDEKMLPFFHYGTPIYMNGAVFKRTVVEELNGFNEEYVICEDTDLIMRMIQRDYVPRWCPFVGAYLRVHPQQSTTDGEVPYDKKKRFEQNLKKYNQDYDDYYIFRKSLTQSKNIIENHMEAELNRSLIESIQGANNVEYKSLSSRYLRDKEAFFILRNEDEERMFMDADLVL